jgi:hypothetical protein
MSATRSELQALWNRNIDTQHQLTPLDVQHANQSSRQFMTAVIQKAIEYQEMSSLKHTITPDHISLAIRYVSAQLPQRGFH